MCPSTTTIIPSTPCLTYTTGGNANGATCIFPFLYEGTARYQCIDTNNGGVLWCGTTPSYDRDRIWGNCAGWCLYEFFRFWWWMLGMHLGDISDATFKLLLFSFKNYHFYNLSDFFSLQNACTEAVCSTTQSRAQVGISSTQASQNCVIYTTGGSANGAPCRFPFKFNGVLYYTCITLDNDGQEWCATVYDYDAIKSWGNCAGTSMFAPLTTGKTVDTSHVAPSGSRVSTLTHNDFACHLFASRMPTVHLTCY